MWLDPVGHNHWWHYKHYIYTFNDFQRSKVAKNVMQLRFTQQVVSKSETHKGCRYF